jgi:hypothetical protein
LCFPPLLACWRGLMDYIQGCNNLRQFISLHYSLDVLGTSWILGHDLSESGRSILLKKTTPTFYWYCGLPVLKRNRKSKSHRIYQFSHKSCFRGGITVPALEIASRLENYIIQKGLERQSVGRQVAWGRTGIKNRVRGAFRWKLYRIYNNSGRIIWT